MYLMNKNSEMNDKILILEKKVENLLKDNEKLKNERNNLRSRGYNKNEPRMFSSHLSSTISSGLSKKYDYGSNYKNAMLKILDNISDDKDEPNDKTTKGNNKNEKSDKKK